MRGCSRYRPRRDASAALKKFRTPGLLALKLEGRTSVTVRLGHLFSPSGPSTMMVMKSGDTSGTDYEASAGRNSPDAYKAKDPDYAASNGEAPRDTRGLTCRHGRDHEVQRWTDDEVETLLSRTTIAYGRST